MRLVDLVSQETGIDVKKIVLLRHSTARVRKMEVRGLSVKEHTPLKTADGEYDYGKHQDDVVVVIVRDCVEGVYRVLGIEAEGNLFSLASESRRKLEIDLGNEDRPARLFRLEQIPSRADNEAISGWTAPIQATLRYHPDHARLFWKIEVSPPDRSPIDVEVREMTDAEIETAIRGGLLRIGMVTTSIQEATTRQRIGMDILRKLTLQNYGTRCAVCDISDAGLLATSHIVGWGESEESRGNLNNVICLCSFHHALFDNGYWSLNDRLGMVVRTDIGSKTIRGLLPAGCSFRKPSAHYPGVEFIRRHRLKHGLCSVS